MVAGHSDLASFLSCRSSGIFFTALPMNKVKLKNTSPLSGTLVD